MVEGTVRRLLASQVQLVLATLSPQGPCTHLMAYATTGDLARVFLASGVPTRKVANIQADPRVSLLWDNRTGRLTDHDTGTLVTAAGTARCVEGPDRIEAREAMLQANPPMRPFLSTADVAFFTVDVVEYQVVVGYGASQSWKPLRN